MGAGEIPAVAYDEVGHGVLEELSLVLGSLVAEVCGMRKAGFEERQEREFGCSAVDDYQIHTRTNRRVMVRGFDMFEAESTYCKEDSIAMSRTSVLVDTIADI